MRLAKNQQVPIVFSSIKFVEAQMSVLETPNEMNFAKSEPDKNQSGC